MAAGGSLTSENDWPDGWARDLLLGAAAKLLIARDSRPQEFGPLLNSARHDLDRVADRHSAVFGVTGPEPEPI